MEKPKNTVKKIKTWASVVQEWIQNNVSQTLLLDSTMKETLNTIKQTEKTILITVRENDNHNETLPILYKILELSKIPYEKRIFDRSLSSEEIKEFIKDDTSHIDKISVMDYTSYDYDTNKKAFVYLNIDNIKTKILKDFLKEKYNAKSEHDLHTDAKSITKREDEALTTEEYLKNVHTKSLIYANQMCQDMTMLMKDILVYQKPNCIVIAEKNIGHHFRPLFIGGYKNTRYPRPSYFVDHNNLTKRDQENLEEKNKYNDDIHKEMALKIADLRKNAWYTGDIKILPYSRTEDEKKNYTNAERDKEDTRLLLDYHARKEASSIKNAKILSPSTFDMALELGISDIIKKEDFEIKYISKILQETSKEIEEKNE